MGLGLMMTNSLADDDDDGEEDTANSSLLGDSLVRLILGWMVRQRGMSSSSQLPLSSGINRFCFPITDLGDEGGDDDDRIHSSLLGVLG